MDSIITDHKEASRVLARFAARVVPSTRLFTIEYADSKRATVVRATDSPLVYRVHFFSPHNGPVPDSTEEQTVADPAGTPAADGVLCANCASPLHQLSLCTWPLVGGGGGGGGGELVGCPVCNAADHAMDACARTHFVRALAFELVHLNRRARGLPPLRGAAGLGAPLDLPLDGELFVPVWVEKCARDDGEEGFNGKKG